MNRRSFFSRAALIAPALVVSLPEVEPMREGAIVTIDACGAGVTLALIARVAIQPNVRAIVAARPVYRDAMTLPVGWRDNYAQVEYNYPVIVHTDAGMLFNGALWHIDDRTPYGTIYSAIRPPKAGESIATWRERYVIAELVNLNDRWMRDPE